MHEGDVVKYVNVIDVTDVLYNIIDSIRYNTKTSWINSTHSLGLYS